MERIASFCIDHLKLERGIYVSRKDYVGKEVLTSFDIRMKRNTHYRAPRRYLVAQQPRVERQNYLLGTYGLYDR